MPTIELIRHNIDTLKDAVALLGTISSEQYIFEDTAGTTSSIGKHIRHIIDHYSSFTSGLVISKIDYDDRQRDEIYEVNLFLAKKRIEEICVKLGEFAHQILTGTQSSGELISVTCSTSAKKGRPICTGSTLERELGFLQNHAIHHFAMIKLILRDQKQTTFDNFGMAPSTIKYLHVRRK